MSAVPFDVYLDSLQPLNAHVDPLADSVESDLIRAGGDSLSDLATVDHESLAARVTANPAWVPALALTVGLSRERLKNVLQHAFGTSSWAIVARSWPEDLIARLDDEYDLLATLAAIRQRSFTFGDLLVARAGTRVTANRAGAAGRRLEDEIEAIATKLGLQSQTRTRFTGRNGRTAPCDLVIPNNTDAAIVVAAKGFDSTGSKLTDAVREIEEMADVRLARQYVIAVVGTGTAHSDPSNELWLDGKATNPGA